jgi:hypothetical protein
MRRVHLPACALAAALALGLLPAAARATAFVVTTISTDPGPMTGQGACLSGGACSLRQAINAANTTADISGAQNSISLPAGTLARNGTLGVPTITAPVTIAGQGARLTTISGSGDPSPSGGLNIDFAARAAVTLRDLTISGGVATIDGGGVRAHKVDLSLERVIVRGNLARADVSATARGGGIAIASGSLTVDDSEISANRVTGVLHANGAAGGLGGGVDLTLSLATVRNTTVAGNTVDAGTGSADGGGINLLGGGVTLDGATVADNTVIGDTTAAGGNIAAAANAVTAKTTLIARGTAPVGENCSAAAVSQGGNVEDRGQCGFSGATDRGPVDPQLGGLQDNGGPTDTMAIPATSPAFDLAGGCALPADQRGVPRPQSIGCDSGAFEATDFGAPATGPGTPPTVPASSAPPRLSRAAQSHSTWREGKKVASFSSKRKSRPPVGTTFSFALDVPARVSFAFTQKLPGRRVAGRCVARSRKNRRKPACTRVATKGALSFAGHAARNAISFSGRLSRSKRLKPGRYTLVIVASKAGLRSSPRSLRFKIVR